MEVLIQSRRKTAQEKVQEGNWIRMVQNWKPRIFAKCSGKSVLNVCGSRFPGEHSGKKRSPLSLYLSLRDPPDERVQQQLETLLEGVSW